MIQQDLNLSLDTENLKASFTPSYNVLNPNNLQAYMGTDSIDNAKNEKDILAMSPKKMRLSNKEDGMVTSYRQRLASLTYSTEVQNTAFNKILNKMVTHFHYDPYEMTE